MTHPAHIIPSPTQLPQLSRRKSDIDALKAQLAQSHLTLNSLLDTITQQGKTLPAALDCIRQLEAIEANLSDFWEPIDYHQSVLQTEAEREAHQEGLGLVTQWHSDLLHNRTLYEWIKHIKHHADFETLEEAAQQTITLWYDAFRLAGIELSPTDRALYQDIQMQLAKDSAQFENNIVDSSREQALLVQDESQLDGLSQRTIIAARQAAQQQGKKGWLLAINEANLSAVMLNANNPLLRKDIYTAWVTRASESTSFDNSQLMYEILKKRHKLSQLTGFHNYAEYSLAHDKMAKSPETVIHFLHQLIRSTYAQAQREFQTLNAFASQAGKIETLSEWDLTYFGEKLAAQKFGIQQEALRAYFPLPHVLKALFKILYELFGLHIEEVKDCVTWDPTVKVLSIQDRQKSRRGYLYLDLYTRSNKRSGAWVNPYIQRRLDTAQRLHLPIAFLTCNFTPPLSGEAALLTHNDVITLFHEMGHALHHTLTQVNYASVSGMAGVPWDAVEFPSQLLDQFPWNAAILERLSSHYQTHEKLPSATIAALVQSHHFQAGLQLIRQLEFSLFDFTLHQAFDPQKGPEQIQDILDNVREVTRVIPVSSFNRFQHSFAHIFSGGYGAGYYGYLWAEQLAADTFSQFLEDGLSNGVLNAETGHRFMTAILEQGGSTDMLILFERFRGRPPDPTALLVQRGINS